jgi:hypothetical protein
MSHGLAWFARQVPTEGFSDVSEGRVAETEIPHSDQWIQPPEHDSKSYRPDKFNRKHVLKSSNKSAGISPILIEEIYQSNEFANNKAPHGATYENGRYVFQYPQAWQSSNSVNKKIALRRIDTKPRDYLVALTFTIGTETEEEDVNITVQIPSTYSIEEALSAMRLNFKQNRPRTWNDVKPIFTYYPSDCDAIFNFDGATEWSVSPTFDQNDEFLEMMNFPLERKAEFYKHPRSDAYEFNNVRSRERGDIFLHASFVSNSTAGYLGRNGEFYPSPSKIYPDDGQSFFYIETSLDGYHRVPMPNENFIVELAFIIDSDNYLGA